MKKSTFLVLAFLLFKISSFCQDSVTSVEAEAGILTGVYTAQQTGNSSGPYVTGFDNDGDKVTVSVTVPSTTNYKLIIRYRGIYGDKKQDVYANNVFVGNVAFPQTTNFEDLNAGTIKLNAGTNTISVQKSWGYMDVDKFSIYTIPANVFNITPALIDAQATASAKDLYSFLVSQFGKKVISGQTDGFYDSLSHVAGKSPLLRSWDFASYSPMYPYKWENGHHVFGAVDNQDAEKAIDWYNGTGKKGIVSLHWHWGSPSGATPGKNTFSTENTTFDVSKAVISGTQENLDAIRDIDAIAVQLKKLQDANVPVLWRPLHEAGGGWFWWGAKGSAPAKALWNIMYDRLTNYHGLHNLIWVWSTPEADWYPGNSKVDILGYDSYPANFNYTTQKNMFDNLFTITLGQKLLAMSENGPIPDMQNVFSESAPWSYFMSWNDLVFSANSTQHILDVFANPQVLTLENYNTALPIILSNFTATAISAKAKIDWTTISEQNNDRFEIERSSDGGKFYKLAAVKGAGNSALIHHYTIFDNNPSNGINYYRLIQYNVDGKSTEHGVRTVNFNISPAASVKAYPNPAINGLGILLSNYTGQNVTLTLTDMAGKVVQQQTIQTGNGQGYYKLSANSAIGAGQYILHVSGKGLQQNLKVLMQ